MTNARTMLRDILTAKFMLRVRWFRVLIGDVEIEAYSFVSPWVPVPGVGIEWRGREYWLG